MSIEIKFENLYDREPSNSKLALEAYDAINDWI